MRPQASRDAHTGEAGLPADAAQRAVELRRRRLAAALDQALQVRIRLCTAERQRVGSSAPTLWSTRARPVTDVRLCASRLMLVCSVARTSQKRSGVCLHVAGS